MSHYCMRGRDVSVENFGGDSSPERALQQLLGGRWEQQTLLDGGSWKQHTLEPPTILATAGHDKENTKKNTKTRNKTKINATLATAVPATQEKTRTKNARMKVEL